MLPERKNVRLKNYDYSEQGYYFVTICAKDRKNILGSIEPVGDDLQIVPQEMPNIILSEIGEIVLENIKHIQNNMGNFTVDCYCLMPNHIHLIIIINGAICKSPPTNGPKTIPRLIAVFKSITKQQSKMDLWQRNYYEHIIRNEKELYEIREYILENPLKWTLDKYYSKWY